MSVRRQLPDDPTRPNLRRRIAPPLTLAVVGGSLGGLLITGSVLPHAAAASSSLTAQSEPEGPLAPFAAQPKVVPFASASAAATKRRIKQAPASAPIRHLPRDLDVQATNIPEVVLAAYVNAAHLADRAIPTCHIDWQLVAGIGFIESDNALSGGSDKPHWDGVASPPILGPVLDGRNGTAAIPDTDDGTLDGNITWDRAVGPMQFIPSTWAEYAADGNGDGVKDPEQIDDATLAAADYLCADDRDLATQKGRLSAIYSYNHSKPYVRDVLTVAAHYMGVSPRSLGVRPGQLGVPAEGKHRKGKHRKIASASPSASASAAASATATPSLSPIPPGSPSPTPSQTTTSPSSSVSLSATPSTSPTPSPTDSTDSPSASPTPTDSAS